MIQGSIPHKVIMFPSGEMQVRLTGVGVVGSDVFSNIPLDYVEEFEPKVFEKRRRETGQKTQSTQSEQSIEAISRTGKLGFMKSE